MRILNILSQFTGKLSKVYIPIPLRRPLYTVFAALYGLNLKEVEYDLSFYNAFSEFFSRNLKLGNRPIEGDFVCPADSLLIDAGEVQSHKLIGIKGCDYTVDDLFGGENISKSFSFGSFFNYYLAPGDYHHVHSPVSGQIIKRIYIPGSLYPVSKLFVRIFSDLYVRQERVITVIRDCNQKLCAVIMVGAYNVGSMGLSYEPEFLTNHSLGVVRKEIKEYPEPKDIEVGARLGTFYLGSTVVVITESQIDFNQLAISLGSKVRYGQMVQR